MRRHLCGTIHRPQFLSKHIMLQKRITACNNASELKCPGTLDCKEHSLKETARGPRYAVGVVGSNDAKGMAHAYATGILLGDKDWVLITGGRSNGVTAEVNKGVKKSNRKLALTVGILPSLKSDMSPDLGTLEPYLNRKTRALGGVSWWKE